MSPDEFSQQMQDAVAAQFPDHQQGQEAVWPSAFFDGGVFFTMPNGQKQPRHPSLCATLLCAASIANVLSSSGRPTLICSSGYTNWAEPGVTDNRKVPYLLFKRDADPDEGPFTGVSYNAASLASYFNHGFPGIRALNSCQCDIERARADAGERGEVSDEEVAKIMAQTS